MKENSCLILPLPFPVPNSSTGKKRVRRRRWAWGIKLISTEGRIICPRLRSSPPSRSPSQWFFLLVTWASRWRRWWSPVACLLVSSWWACVWTLEWRLTACLSLSWKRLTFTFPFVHHQSLNRSRLMVDDSMMDSMSSTINRVNEKSRSRGQRNPRSHSLSQPSSRLQD